MPTMNKNLLFKFFYTLIKYYGAFVIKLVGLKRNRDLDFSISFKLLMVDWREVAYSYRLSPT